MKNLNSVQRSFLFNILALIVIGIVMIYNSTVIYAQGTFGEAYKFIILHIGWLLIGSISFIIVYKIDYHKLPNYLYPLLFFTIGPLSLLAVIGLLRQTNLIACTPDSFLFPCINGASRWIYLNFPFLTKLPFINSLSFQPAELAKLVLIIYLAYMLSKFSKSARFETSYEPLKITLIATGIVSFLIFLQPNLSTASLVFLIGLSVYFASGFPLKPFLYIVPGTFLAGLLFILLSDYRRARLLTLFNSSTDASLGAGYHIQQIQIALGSGGFWGLGIGQSRQKFQYLPEVAADSIFAIIGEELGFIGTTAVVVLFLTLIYKGYTIAKLAPDLLGSLLAVGITTWIGFQFFVNVAAMTQILPLTGVPLPLISYGGSSTIFTLMGLGILMNISKHV